VLVSDAAGGIPSTAVHHEAHEGNEGKNAFFMLFMSFMVIRQFVVGIYWMRIPTRKSTNGETNT
jgi:hypothetical protein